MATIFGKNRFFNDTAETDSSARVHQIVPKLLAVEENLAKLCAMKQDKDAPQRALDAISLLKKEVIGVLQGTPTPKQENMHKNEAAMAPSV